MQKRTPFSIFFTEQDFDEFQTCSVCITRIRKQRIIGNMLSKDRYQLQKEGTDIDGMRNTLKEQLGEADSEFSQLAESILEKAKEKYGSDDLESLKEIVTPVLEQLLGDGADLGELEDLGNIDLEKLLAQD